MSVESEENQDEEREGRNAHGQTPFLEACWFGNVEIAEKLFQEDPSVVDDVDSFRKMTALHIVCHQIIKNFFESTHLRYWRLLKFLLQRTSINIDAQDATKRTALHYLLANRLRTNWLVYEIEMLLEKKPDMTLEDGEGKKAESPRDFPFFHKFFADQLKK